MIKYYDNFALLGPLSEDDEMWKWDIFWILKHQLNIWGNIWCIHFGWSKYGKIYSPPLVTSHTESKEQSLDKKLARAVNYFLIFDLKKSKAYRS